MDIQEILTLGMEKNASDCHLSVGLPPMLRIDGDLQHLPLPVLDQAKIESLISTIMNDRQKQQLAENFDVDFSFAIPGIARFRANVFKQNRGISCAFRTIATEIKHLDELGMPSICRQLASKPRGLVLVTGPTGSGKSTTLTAMIDHINATSPVHILSIEDPIEFIHTSKIGLVNQREVSQDTVSFSQALRAALREDPDVIMIGELRDIETIRLALTAAETGHLVFATLHTSSATKSINRIIDVFPGEEQSMVRALLAESLQGVISQSLLKRSQGSGRLAATEVMVCTPAIRNLIREGKIAQMYSTIQTGQRDGMHTLDQCLQDLISRGLITRENAQVIAHDANQIKA